MGGALYLVFAFFFGLSGGIIGKMKGSSFWLWFLLSALIPFIGVLCALLYRRPNEELRRQCPNCGRVTALYDALCTRCGTELDYPDDPGEIIPSVNEVYRAHSAR